MPEPSEWLPDLVTLADCDGNWSSYLETIYEYFCADFVRSKPAYPDKRFALKRYPVSQEKEATFWHLISEGRDEEERIPDMRRCERIRWPRPMIEAVESERVYVWRNVRGRNERTLIAVDDFSYVVVLDEREDYVLLWTAFYVEREHRRKKLAKEYETWKANAKNG